MKRKILEKGQALILIVFAIIGLVALTALAVDGSAALTDRQSAQTSADSAALGAALAKIRGQDYHTAAINRAASNGYTNDGTKDIVEVYLCSDTVHSSCGDYAGDPEYIQVIITSNVDADFAPVIGIQQMTNKVQAIARGKPGGGAALFDGAGVVTLKKTGTALSANGNVTLDVNNSGVFVNSSSNCAMNVNGIVNLSVDTAYSIVGTYCQNGIVHVVGPIQSATQVDYPPQIEVTAPSITCTGNGYLSGTTYYPGNYNGLTINGNGNYTFAPGSYCFNNTVTVNGNINLTANDVQFSIHAGGFDVNGNTTFTGNNILVHSAGGTGMHFNGNGAIHCTNTSFYMEKGSVLWNGNVSNYLTAPTTGTYKNLLIYMPYGNSSSLTINGNSGSTLTGSIVAISAPITINGNSGTTGFHSQIVGYTVTLNGNSNTIINYVDSENYDVLTMPEIQLIR